MRSRSHLFVTVVVASILLLTVVCWPIAFSAPVEAQTGDPTEPQAEPDIDWRSGSGNSATTQDLQVEALGDDPIEFGPAVGRSLQVQNVDTGDTVTLTPSNETTYNVTELEVNFDELREGSPTMDQLRLENGEVVTDYNVTVDGDVTAFYDDTFGTYTVQLLDSTGAVIAEPSEPKLRGVGYEYSFKYNGSVLAADRDPGVESDWYVVLNQRIDGEFQEIATGTDTTGESLTIETTGTDFDPNAGTVTLELYPSSEQTEPKDTIFTMFSAGGLAADAIVEGPIGTDSDAAYAADSAAADYDADDDGQITTPELGTAATEYANGDVNITDLGEVATAYANS